METGNGRWLPDGYQRTMVAAEAKVPIAADRPAGFDCPPGKAQVFPWDSMTPGLALRVTSGGACAFVFQRRFGGGTLRVTIGSPDTWTIEQAQQHARALQVTIDAGRDPRVVEGDGRSPAGRTVIRRPLSCGIDAVGCSCGPAGPL